MSLRKRKLAVVYFDERKLRFSLTSLDAWTSYFVLVVFGVIEACKGLAEGFAHFSVLGVEEAGAIWFLPLEINFIQLINLVDCSVYMEFITLCNTIFVFAIIFSEEKVFS